jgi:hypothetical protein
MTMSVKVVVAAGVVAVVSKVGLRGAPGPDTAEQIAIASGYAGQAATSAGQAATSATSAAGSATAAAGSATTAQAAQTAAVAAKDTAVTAKNDAVTAKDAARHGSDRCSGVRHHRYDQGRRGGRVRDVRLRFCDDGHDQGDGGRRFCNGGGRLRHCGGRIGDHRDDQGR